MFTSYVVLINVAYSLEGDQLGVNCMTYTQYVAHNKCSLQPRKACYVDVQLTFIGI